MLHNCIHPEKTDMEPCVAPFQQEFGLGRPIQKFCHVGKGRHPFSDEFRQGLEGSIQIPAVYSHLLCGSLCVSKPWARSHLDELSASPGSYPETLGKPYTP